MPPPVFHHAAISPALGGLLDAIPQAILICDLAGNIVLANGAAAKLFGSPPEELCTRTVEELVPDGRRAAHAGLRANYARDPVPRPMAHRSSRVAAVRRDGTEFPAEIALGPLEAGGAMFVVATINDFTNHKRMEEVVRQRELSLREAQRIARVGSWEWDVQLSRLQWSDELCRLFGVVPNDSDPHAHRAFLERVHAEDRARLISVVERAVDGAGTFDVEYRVLGAAGEYVVVQSRGDVAHGADGKPLKVRGVSHDITDRKLAEESARREMARWMEAAFAALDEAVLIVSADRLIVNVNEAGESMFGYCKDELVDRSTEILHVDQAHHAEFGRRITEAFEKNESAHFEYEARRKNGEVFPTEHTVSLLKDDAGEPIGIVSVVRDITDRRRAEKERLELEAQKLTSLTVLAGGVAHDFNNIMSTILSNAYVAASSLPRNAPELALIEDIRDAAQRAGELATHMLAYSGRGRFLVDDVDVNGLLRGMQRLLESTAPDNITLEFELGTDVPLTRADATQLRRVVTNLVINASESAEGRQGRVSIRTYWSGRGPAEPRGPDDGRVVIEVADDGSGMSEETIKRMYEPFFSTKVGGRGLGLAVIQGIVRQHRGVIEVESEPGRGTTFRVLLRARPAELDRSGDSPQAGPGSVSKGTILVVDDDEAVRRSTARVLSHAGIAVLTASDGLEAIEKVREHVGQIDCILLDLRMPRMDGEAALVEIRKVSSSVPVVIHSAFGDEGAAERLGSLGISGFVEKPSRPDALADKLRLAMVKAGSLGAS